MKIWNTGELPKFLKSYGNSDYITQSRALFLYYLSIILIITLTVEILYSIISQVTGIATMNLSAAVMVPLLLMFTSILFCFWLLTKGKINVASNILPFILIASILSIMFFDKSSSLTRLDNVVYIFAVLSIIPLLTNERKMQIVFYPVISIIVLILFLITSNHELGLTKIEVWDYLIDLSVSLIFVATVGYYIHVINRKSLQLLKLDIAKRIATENALQKSEKKYREMALLLPQVVYESEIDGTLTYINKAGFEMFGFTAEDLAAGVNVLQTIIPAEHKLAHENIAKVLKGVDSEGSLYTGLKKDGTTFPIRIYSSAIVENETTVGLRGVIFDVSDLMKAQDNLKKSNKLFRDLIDMTPVAITLADLEGRFILANNSFCSDLKLTKEDILGKTAKELGIKISKEDELYIRSQLLEKGYVNTYETVMSFRNKVKFDLYISAIVIDFNDQKAILRTTVNITDKKQLERKLRESETLFRLIVNMVPFTIAIQDIENRYTFVNNSFLERFNFSTEDVYGKTISDLGFKVDKTIEKQINDELFYHGKVLNKEISIISPQNEQIFEITSCQPFKIDGKIHYVSTTVDITDHKLLENQLKEYNLKLEETVSNRTSELANALEQLQTVNEELMATNEELYAQREQLETTLDMLKSRQEQLIDNEKMASLGILTSGVAHEINNPLNYIYNGTMAIENYIIEYLPAHHDKLKPFINAINTGINRTTGIITSLNSYSRTDISGYTFCNLHQILENCLTMLLGQYKFRIEIIRDYDNALPLIHGSEGKLHQALLNVLLNAIQAIDETGTIRIKTTHHENTVTIVIADTGCGISSENIRNIFDPFFTTRDPGKGTGLGLSITKSILKEHKGSIQCKSEIAAGSEFIINLPINQ